MLHYIPRTRDQLAGHKWLWLDLPNGDRIMLLDAEDGVALPEEVVCALASNVLEDHPSKAG